MAHFNVDDYYELFPSYPFFVYNKKIEMYEVSPEMIAKISGQKWSDFSYYSHWESIASNTFERNRFPTQPEFEESKISNTNKSKRGEL
jgi:hypothetical protein